MALTGPRLVHGIAPDGAAAATLHWSGGSTTVPVLENAFEIRAPVSAGDTVRVAFDMVRECRPAQELLDAVPALRDGAWGALPVGAEELLPSGGRRVWVRHAEGFDGLELWAVARCEEAEEKACVLGVYGGRPLALPCAGAREIRRHGTWWTFPVGGRLAVTGMAPGEARSVEVVLDSRLVHEVPLRGGLFGGLLPPEFGRSVDPGESAGPIELRFPG